MLMKRKTVAFPVRSFFILAVTLLFPCGLFAERASLEMARKVGKANLLAQREFSRQPRERSSHLGPGEEYSIARAEPLVDPDAERTLAYILHLSPHGYIVVSGDTDITPVIAYSYRCDFVTEDSALNIPLHMVTWDMQDRLDAIPATPQKIKLRNNEEWDKFLRGDPSFLAERGKLTTWGYWLDTTWSQSGIYYAKCPIDPQTGTRCVTGCVATAMAQIVNYWEFPYSMSFSSPADDYVSSSTTPSISIDGDAGTYDFPSFPTLSASLSSINYNGSGSNPTDETIADIMFACGVSVSMQYSSGGSGAMTSDVAVALLNKCGYHTAEVKDPDVDPDFYTVLSGNMKAAHPAQLSIAQSGGFGGHSIVCDGYQDSDDTYHLNYGWGGSSDGWYSLPDGMPAGYTILKYAVVNIVAIPGPTPTPTPTPTPAPKPYVSAFKHNSSSLSLKLYRKPEMGDWTYWDAAARNPYALVTDGAAIPGGDVVACTDVDIDGDGRDELAVVKRELGWDMNLYLYEGVRPPSQSNKFPIARDFWMIPAGNNLLAMANPGDVNGDGREDLAVLRREGGGDYNLYIYNSPVRGDATYDDAWARNMVALAWDLWIIPEGNDIISMAGVDLDGDFKNDGLAVVRNQSGDRNLYVWRSPAAGEWSIGQARARQNGYGGLGTPQARDFWIIPGGNEIVDVFAVQYLDLPEGNLGVLRSRRGDQNLFVYNLPRYPDRTYYDAVSRNPSPLARDFWVIPSGNSIADALGTD